MQIHDISVTLNSSTPVWPGDPQLNFSKAASIAAGDIVNVTGLSLSTHSGTHVDAPLHFLANGSTMDEMDLSLLMGPCQVIDFSKHPIGQHITAIDLAAAKIHDRCKRLLIKTPNSGRLAAAGSQFLMDYTAITPDAAEWIVQAGIHLVGIDYLSIAPFDNAQAVHLPLLNSRVIILETINLTKIEAGNYDLVCLPLRIGAADGAPARALLVERD